MKVLNFKMRGFSPENMALLFSARLVHVSLFMDGKNVQDGSPVQNYGVPNCSNHRVFIVEQDLIGLHFGIPIGSGLMLKLTKEMDAYSYGIGAVILLWSLDKPGGDITFLGRGVVENVTEG